MLCKGKKKWRFLVSVIMSYAAAIMLLVRTLRKENEGYRAKLRHYLEPWQIEKGNDEGGSIPLCPKQIQDKTITFFPKRTSYWSMSDSNIN